MKVKDYLVNRILDLEKELKNLKTRCEQLMIEIKEADAHCDRLTDRLDDYEIEREHIKQIITYHLSPGGELGINLIDPDRETLLAILDIKPEDVETVGETITPPHCWGCKYEELEGNLEPCVNCTQGNKKEVTPDAEAKD